MPIFIGRNVSISHLKGTVELKVLKTGIIRIGFGPFGIGVVKYERSSWDVQGKVIFNGKTHFGHGCRIDVQKNGILYIGDGVSITGNSSILVKNTISIGDDSILAWDMLIMDCDWHQIIDKQGNILNPAKPIKIGNHVWIDCRTTILKGTNIPNDSIIAAASIVSGELSTANSIYGSGGVRMIKENTNWLR